MQSPRTTLALALLVSGSLSPAFAAVPALGTAEGEQLCAGWTNVMASGAMLTTGGDALPAVKAHGIFLGRLSVIAPEARYRLKDFLDAYDRLTPAEQDQLTEVCSAKLSQIDPTTWPEVRVRDAPRPPP